MTRLLAAFVLILALAGCGDKGEKQQGGKAEGQILPGAVSDAMIPVDQVRSQAPLAPRSPDKGDEDEPEDAATGDATSATPTPSEAAAATSPAAGGAAPPPDPR